MRAPLMSGLRVLFLVLAFAQTAQAQHCRLALALALDVSGSVDPTEYAQQVNGLADALADTDVRRAILAGGGAHVSLAVYEWSSRNHQIVIQPWIVLNTPSALDAATLRIRSHRKKRAGLKTALGTALSFGASLFVQQSHCWNKTLDVSGDGENNIGPNPALIAQSGILGHATVNALVIGGPNETERAADLELLDYFEKSVIYGPAAFAMIAQGYEDYAEAMRRKLLRELEMPVLGLIDP